MWQLILIPYQLLNAPYRLAYHFLQELRELNSSLSYFQSQLPGLREGLDNLNSQAGEALSGLAQVLERFDRMDHQLDRALEQFPDTLTRFDALDDRFGVLIEDLPLIKEQIDQLTKVGRELVELEAEFSRLNETGAQMIPEMREGQQEIRATREKLDELIAESSRLGSGLKVVLERVPGLKVPEEMTS